MSKIKIGIDSDCIISLFNCNDEIHKDMQSIDRLHKLGKIDLHVSLKTIDQLSGEAIKYASSLPKLPNYVIGTIGDQVGTIGSLAGTFGDTEKNEALHQKIKNLIKKGVNMRDRQIVIDSSLGGMDILLTNDRGLCGKKTVTNLQKELGFLVLNPKKLLQYLANRSETAALSRA